MPEVMEDRSDVVGAGEETGCRSFIEDAIVVDGSGSGFKQ